MGNATHTGQKKMAESKIELSEQQRIDIENERAFHYRLSYAFGWVRIYSPKGDITQWDNLPWVLETTQGGPKGIGMRYKLKSKYVMEAFQSPGLVPKYMLFGQPDLKPQVLEEL